MKDQRETNNERNKYAVAIVRRNYFNDTNAVGHVSQKITSLLCF